MPEPNLNKILRPNTTLSPRPKKSNGSKSIHKSPPPLFSSQEDNDNDSSQLLLNNSLPSALFSGATVGHNRSPAKANGSRRKRKSNRKSMIASESNINNAGGAGSSTSNSGTGMANTVGL